MATTLMINNTHNDLSNNPTTNSEPIINQNYHRFFQLRLRQMITENHNRREREARKARLKQLSSRTTDNKLSEQRLHKECMQYIREKSKIQAQDDTVNKIEDYRKRTERETSNLNATPTLTIVSTSMSSSMECRPRPILRSRQNTTTPTPTRARSVPINYVKPINKPVLPQTPKIERVDSPPTFTSITTSSSRNYFNPHHCHARQTILETIMLHLNNHKMQHISKSPSFQAIHNRFSSSIAPNVYRNFERITA